MTVRGYPFDTSSAAGSVTELEWRRLMQWIMPSGVIRGADNGFAVTERAAGANMSVDVATGQAFIVGHYVRSDAVESVAIPDNATGNPRIDTIVVGFDFVANASSVYRVAGAVAAAPAPADLTQDLTTTWEIPLAYVYVAAGENVSIVNAEISDRRQYADPQTQQQGKEPVRLATAAALAASTVTGVARVANANGALGNIDGVAAVVGDRVLDKDHATTQHRGIWVVEDVGSASKPWRMRRAPASDESAEVRAGMWVRVTEGSANADTGWLLTTNDPIVLGTTGLTFTQFPPSSIGGSVGDLVGYKSARKTSPTNIASNVTVADIAEMTVALAPGTWEFIIPVIYRAGNAGAGGKLVHTPGFSGTATGYWSHVALAVATSTQTGDVFMAARTAFGAGQESAVGGDLNGSPCFAIIHGVIIVTVAGNLTYMAAQSASHATNTIIYENSRIIAERFA